jgi:hypothetical protein
MTEPEEVNFGRLPAHGLGEDKDEQYPLRALLPRRVELPRYKYWSFFHQPLDQGSYGTCVGHGGKHWMLAAPIVQTKPTAPPTAVDLYRECLPIDEWAGNDGGDMYFGTSVRALFKVLKNRGLVSEYRWALSPDDVREWVSLKGPLVIGVNWYAGMMNPDSLGYLNLTGGVIGGHCVIIIGTNNVRRDYTILNSWGRWGIKGNGRALITHDAMNRLIFSEWGEAAAGLETRLPR